MAILNEEEILGIRKFAHTYLGASMGADAVQLQNLLDTIDDRDRQIEELKKQLRDEVLNFCKRVIMPNKPHDPSCNAIKSSQNKNGWIGTQKSLIRRCTCGAVKEPEEETST